MKRDENPISYVKNSSPRNSFMAALGGHITATKREGVNCTGHPKLPLPDFQVPKAVARLFSFRAPVGSPCAAGDVSLNLEGARSSGNGLGYNAHFGPQM